MLTREQADAVASAVMVEGRERQRERAQKREAERLQELIRKRWAAVLIALMVAGAVVAYLKGQHVPYGVLGGAIAGQLVALGRGAWRKDSDGR